jgi:hypothetical protein
MFLLAAVLAAAAAAQDPNAPGGPPGTPPGPAAEEPKEPPAWKAPDKDSRKLEELLAQYLGGPAKERAEVLKKIEKALEKPVDGHSMLEDVDGLVAIANRARGLNTKLKKAQIQEMSVAPEVHGFPNIGTVKYWLYVPKDYPADHLWPLLFCMPDQKAHGDGKKYIEDWIAKSTNVAQSFLVAVPQAHAKGAEWTSPESLARAMLSLRHAAGTFGIDPKDGGPATDYLRVFIEGEDEASVIAARFPEAFAGAILRGADGRTGARPNVAAAGQLSGLPAFCVVDPKSKSQREFAQRIQSKSGASVVIEDDTLAGNPAAIGLWMEKLPARPAQPREIAYSVHDGSFQRHHWISVLDFDASVEPAASFTATADRAKNEVLVDVEGIGRFELFLSDALVDLNRPVRIVVSEGDKEFLFFANKEGRDTLSRDLGTMLDELLDSNHPWRVYPVKLVVDVREMRERAAAAEAPAPAEGAGKPAGDGAKPAGDAGKPQSAEAAK